MADLNSKSPEPEESGSPHSVEPPAADSQQSALRTGPPNWLRPLLLLLVGLAFAGSSYLAWLALSGSTAAGCGGEGGCATVLGSRWSRWLGMPVAIPAASLFLTVLAALVFADPRIPSRVRELSWNVVWTLGLLAGGAAGWFWGLQSFWLSNFCPYCVSVHVTALLVAVLLIAYYPQPTSRRRMLAGLATLGLALLIGGQLALKPPASYEWVEARQLGGGEPFVLGLPENELEVSLLEGLIEVRDKRFPQWGQPDAQQTLLLLFDYTCPHCRALQQSLTKLLEQDPSRYRVILVPVALWPGCNPYVTDRDQSHFYACDLAKLSLAVWQVCPEAWPELNRWLVFQDVAPSADQALEHARTLCSAEDLEDVLADQQIELNVQAGAQLYAFLQGGLLPKLLFPQRLLLGEVTSFEQLEAILEERR